MLYNVIIIRHNNICPNPLNAILQKQLLSSFECLLRFVVLHVSYCLKRVFVYGPFCHGAFKLDFSTT